MGGKMPSIGACGGFRVLNEHRGAFMQLDTKSFSTILWLKSLRDRLEAI